MGIEGSGALRTAARANWRTTRLQSQVSAARCRYGKRRNKPTPTNSGSKWQLPPLILHPFNERVSPSELLENSKAALMLCGLMPPDGSDRAILRRKLLRARYSEIRMLFYLGKDVARWIEQCLEWSERIPELAELRLAPQSFAHLLAKTTPAPVREKLLRWGVADFESVFSRAIGIHALFSEPPPFETCSETFLENYYRFGDAVFLCFMDLQPWRPIPVDDFELELYASGEYTRKLESEWEHG